MISLDFVPDSDVDALDRDLLPRDAHFWRRVAQHLHDALHVRDTHLIPKPVTEMPHKFAVLSK